MARIPLYVKTRFCSNSKLSVSRGPYSSILVKAMRDCTCASGLNFDLASLKLFKNCFFPRKDCTGFVSRVATNHRKFLQLLSDFFAIGSW
jgi:hypothetical protein